MEVGAIPLALDVFVEIAQLESLKGNFHQAFILSQYVLGQTASTPEAKDQACRLSAEAGQHPTEGEIRETRSWAETNSMEEIVEALFVADVK